jgi:hypothetical protein
MATALTPLLVGIAVAMLSTALIIVYPKQKSNMPDRLVFLTMTITFLVCCYVMYSNILMSEGGPALIWFNCTHLNFQSILQLWLTSRNKQFCYVISSGTLKLMQ